MGSNFAGAGRWLNTPDHFLGDEDNGEMAAWHVFSALGFFRACPGHPSYVLGSPLLPPAAIHLANGTTLTAPFPHIRAYCPASADWVIRVAGGSDSVARLQ